MREMIAQLRGRPQNAMEEIPAPNVGAVHRRRRIAQMRLSVLGCIRTSNGLSRRFAGRAHDITVFRPMALPPRVNSHTSIASIDHNQPAGPARKALSTTAHIRTNSIGNYPLRSIRTSSSTRGGGSFANKLDLDCLQRITNTRGSCCGAVARPINPTVVGNMYAVHNVVILRELTCQRKLDSLKLPRLSGSTGNRIFSDSTHPANVCSMHLS